MQRVLILLACIAGCSFAGLRFAELLRRRAQALTELRAGLQMLISATAHTNRPLAKIAAEVAESTGSAFWRLFSERMAAGEDAHAACCAALDKGSARGGPLYALTARDRALMASFAATLGRTDRHTQQENGRMTLEALSASIEAAETVYAKKGRIYRALGLFMGLGIGILLW